MNEKQFQINGKYSKSLRELVGVIRDNDEDMYMTDVVDLLNQLNDENKHLKLKNHGLEEKVYDLLEDKQALMNFIREKFPKNYETIFEEIQVH